MKHRVTCLERGFCLSEPTDGSCSTFGIVLGF